ncbi:HaaA family cyclophane-containing RiPP peptide [Streptomyces sp. NBC_00670]|jgi:hypothetical protein|uniref:HaaA family cyclophane-containing RiPP peptide n=1 Tax=Streptomyces sp. NBC_00670 TaxID=2975804 RepID=UPI002E3125F7|nr:HaaA family cyclophane-containing RiPP peptide [Streptomyces sp. NBC_00670]
MTSPTSASLPLDTFTLSTRHALDPVTDNPVLDQVAERVRRRLAAERDTPDRFGVGTHAASLIRPRPS